MDKIKEKVIKIYPKIHKLYKEVSEDCAKNGCMNCSFYTYPESVLGLCIYCSLSEFHNAVSELIMKENLKEKN